MKKLTTDESKIALVESLVNEQKISFRDAIKLLAEDETQQIVYPNYPTYPTYPTDWWNPSLPTVTFTN